MGLPAVWFRMRYTEKTVWTIVQMSDLKLSIETDWGETLFIQSIKYSHDTFSIHTLIHTAAHSRKRRWIFGSMNEGGWMDMNGREENSFVVGGCLRWNVLKVGAETHSYKHTLHHFSAAKTLHSIEKLQKIRRCVTLLWWWRGRPRTLSFIHRLLVIRFTRILHRIALCVIYEFRS